MVNNKSEIVLLKDHLKKGKKMNKAIGIVVVIGMIFVLAGTAQASVLNFEVLTSYAENIPANYGGFNWDNNLYAISEGTFYSENTITFPSSYWAVFNGYGALTSTITRDSSFDFNGANFVPWLYQNQIYEYSSTTITMKGYNGLSLVGEVTYSLTNSFDYYAANFYGIDKLELIASENPNPTNNENARWWLMDNFTYNAEAGEPIVPEPATMALFGIGSAAMALVRRKKKVS